METREIRQVARDSVFACGAAGTLDRRRLEMQGNRVGKACASKRAQNQFFGLVTIELPLAASTTAGPAGNDDRSDGAPMHSLVQVGANGIVDHIGFDQSADRTSVLLKRRIRQNMLNFAETW